jgi:hypothetical protein
MKEFAMNGGISPRILIFGTGLRYVVSFILRSLYPPGKRPRYPFDTRLDGPKAGLDVKSRKIPASFKNRISVVQVRKAI